MDKLVSAYLVKLRRGYPFLATLSLYIKYQVNEQVERFETDGRNARINKSYLDQLNIDQQMGMLLHLTLHSALLHPVRAGARIPEVWNIAADIVVNAIVATTSFSPPPDTAVEPRYADLSVEQVYAKLLSSATNLTNKDPGPDQSSVGGCEADGGSEASGDLLNDNADPGEPGSPANCRSTAGGNAAMQQQSRVVTILQTLYPTTADLADGHAREQPGTRVEQKQLEAYWKQAMTRAKTAEQISGKLQGDLPAGLSREIDQVLSPQIDWRVLLWRFMARTPCDFSGFDRRFIHQGLYLDQLEGESLSVRIAMDTSGSIEDHELAQFRAEVESVVRCYAHIDAQLYFVDAEVYGPYPLSAYDNVTRAKGGGGTSFAAFFEHLETEIDPFEQTVCIYLTDGYGDFPPVTPRIPVLWVVTEEGYDEYPFGEVARLAY